jgi:hypothetical protein
MNHNMIELLAQMADAPTLSARFAALDELMTLAEGNDDEKYNASARAKRSILRQFQAEQRAALLLKATKIMRAEIDELKAA